MSLRPSVRPSALFFSPFFLESIGPVLFSRQSNLNLLEKSHHGLQTSRERAIERQEPRRHLARSGARASLARTTRGRPACPIHPGGLACARHHARAKMCRVHRYVRRQAHTGIVSTSLEVGRQVPTYAGIVVPTIRCDCTPAFGSTSFLPVRGTFSNVGYVFKNRVCFSNNVTITPVRLVPRSPFLRENCTPELKRF